MSRMPKYRAKTDATQGDIVEALRKAGWEVHVIRKPVDLLCLKHGTARLLEAKTATGKRKPAAKWRKDQQTQNEFCRRTGTPRVTTAEEALRALGEIL